MINTQISKKLAVFPCSRYQTLFPTGYKLLYYVLSELCLTLCIDAKQNNQDNTHTLRQKFTFTLAISDSPIIADKIWIVSQII